MSEIAVTPKHFLEEMVAKINGKAESFAGISWILGYDFTASDDGLWYIVLEDGEAQGPFEGENSEATITTSAPFEVFVEQSKEKFNPMTAMWNTGKMRYHGDAMVAHRFNKLLNS
jgi:putative sterol carrier protein